MNKVEVERIKRTVEIELFHVSSDYAFITPIQTLESARERER